MKTEDLVPNCWIHICLLFCFWVKIVQNFGVKIWPKISFIKWIPGCTSWRTCSRSRCSRGCCRGAAAPSCRSGSPGAMSPHRGRRRSGVNSINSLWVVIWGCIWGWFNRYYFGRNLRTKLNQCQRFVLGFYLFIYRVFKNLSLSDKDACVCTFGMSFI
jgi:hypothetical protein